MDADIAVIGGGPAGCAAALVLQSRGYSTLVICAPDARERPTETAVPELRWLIQLLGAPDALSACEPCHGIESSWGRGDRRFQSSVVNPLGHPWFVHRRRFDRCLQRAVCDSGAIWIPERARSFNYNEAGVSIVTANAFIRARWLVIATGSPASAAHFTQQKVADADSLVAFWAHLPMRYDSRLLHIEPTDCGWWYLCPADGFGAFACFVTDPLSARALRPTVLATWNALFQTTKVFQHLAEKPFAECVNAAITGLAALPRTYGLRWIAVGDAAAKLDPLGSSGTTTALDSGLRAGQAIADALQGDTENLTRYAKWNDSLVREFGWQREWQYQLEARRRGDGFWSRRMVSNSDPFHRWLRSAHRNGDKNRRTAFADHRSTAVVT